MNALSRLDKKVRKTILVSHGKMQIKVIGYYYHFNFGDDQYQDSIRTFFTMYLPINVRATMDFIDCDTIENIHFDSDDIIVIGGGDLLNKYFVSTLYNKFQNSQNTVIVLSAGLPFTSYIDELVAKLSFVSYFFIRSMQDIKLFKNAFGESKVSYIPDLSCLLDYPLVQPRATVSVVLSRHFYDRTYNESYDSLLEQFVQVLRYISIHYNLHIVFVPFNIGNPIENDTLIHKDVSRKLEQRGISSTLANVSDYGDAFQVIAQSKVCIASRFHAILFSLYAKVPVLPVYTTRKVSNLVMDINLPFHVKLDTLPSGVPIAFDVSDMLCQFHKLVHSTFDFDKIHKHFQSSVEKTSQLVIHSITRNQVVHKDTQHNKVENAYVNVLQYVNRNGFAKLSDVTSDAVRYTAVRIVSYYLTGSTESVFNWGLNNKMFSDDYDYNSEFNWILQNVQVTPQYNSVTGLFNLHYLDQSDHSGVHRSGWQYVYEAMCKYHKSDSVVLFDLYMDRTFHWAEEALRFVGVIPYTRYWVGVLHHTFDTTFSEYNCEKLLKCKSFLQSLRYCKAIIVLSSNLKLQLSSRLCALGFKIPVYNFVHPTETDVIGFDLKAFKANPDKQIVHIGGWLRNVHLFYTLKVPSTVNIKFGALSRAKKVSFRKVALKGRENNNYFPGIDLKKSLEWCLKTTEPQPEFVKCISTGGSPGSSTGISNNWHRHFYENTVDVLNSVEVIDHLSEQAYDNLLSQNIVYINLVDASAVNTLVECIVRNTPIIINRLPSVVELLGKDYPLYTDSLNSIDTLLPLVPKAYYYLKKIPKTQFQIEYFVDRIKQLFEVDLKV